MRSDVHIVAACMFIGADATAAPIASTARTIVAMPKSRGSTRVSAQSFPIVHHQIPRTKSAATTRSKFPDAAMPIVIVAVPAAVPSTAPLERTGRCRTCRFAIAGSSRP